MYWVSYWWKRDQRNMLTSNMISLEYITTIIVSTTITFFDCFCLNLFFFRNERWIPRNEWTRNFESDWRKLHHLHLKWFSKCMEITLCLAHTWFPEAHVLQRVQESEIWLNEREMVNNHDWDQRWAGKARGLTAHQPHWDYFMPRNLGIAFLLSSYLHFTVINCFLLYYMI